jgi:outer membrane protein
MKTNILFLLFTLMAMGALSTQAQALKIGYTNTDYILSKLPEAKQIESDLKTHRDQLGAQLRSKQEEFERKYKSFIEGQATMTDVVKNDVQTELQAMQESIQKFATEAEKSMQNKQIQLLAPVYEKIYGGIKEVAQEQGFSHVFSHGVLLFATKENDISNLVLAKLGVETTPN